MSDRYDTSMIPEGQYQPGSGDRVLLNKLGITDPDEMDDIELLLLDELQTRLLDDIESDQRIFVEDLCQWHRDWLGQVYEWAGEYRSVNMQKGNFPFAAAARIPGLMHEFDDRYLSQYTPCEGFDEPGLIDALAVCHIELIIIHPFREGNGRLARVLATIMALQAGEPLMDFTYLAENEALYISAIHQGHAGDYEARFFRSVESFEERSSVVRLITCSTLFLVSTAVEEATFLVTNRPDLPSRFRN